MNLDRLPITDLKPAPYNPRVALKPGDPRFEKLRRSLDEFDLVQPIVWNRRTGHVVGGHQRLEVLRHQGVAEVDCVIVDLPLEKEKALNITLNNAEVASDWDPDKLLPLIEELQDLPDFDPTLTGFDDQQLHDLLLAPDPAGPDAWGSDDDLNPDTIRATLEVPTDDWETIRPTLDTLLAHHPSLTLHIRLPPTSDQ